MLAAPSKGTHAVLPFCDWLISLGTVRPRLRHAARGSISFSRLSNVPLPGGTACSSAEGHLGHFPISAVTHGAATNVSVLTGLQGSFHF